MFTRVLSRAVRVGAAVRASAGACPEPATLALRGLSTQALPLCVSLHRMSVAAPLCAYRAPSSSGIQSAVVEATPVVFAREFHAKKVTNKRKIVKKYKMKSHRSVLLPLFTLEGCPFSVRAGLPSPLTPFPPSPRRIPGQVPSVSR